MIKVLLLTHSRRLCNWLRAIFHWLIEPRIFWLFLFVVVVALIFATRTSATESEIRLTGLALQVLGITTVAWDIYVTQVLFDHPGFFTLAKKWLVRFPRYGGRVIMSSGNITGAGSTVRCRGYISSTAPRNATVEERLSVLEKDILNLNKRIEETQTEMDQSFLAQSNALEEERQVRSREDQLVSAKLKTTETGGLHVSAMGVFLLLIGVILSTASVELSALLK